MNFVLLIGMKRIRDIIESMLSQIWKVRLAEMNPYTAFFVKQLRIIIIVSRGFGKDKLPVQSAGLTFYTMLSVVPVVALAFAVAKGFGLEEALNKQLQKALSGQPEVADYILLYANRMLENTQGGVLAAAGVVILLWTVIRLLSNVEQSFNDIWQVGKGRSWIRKFTDYFSIILMAPIFVVMAGSMTVMLSTQMEGLMEAWSWLSAIGPVIFFLVKLIPYTLIWFVFTLVYMVMPNTKVDFKSAFIAGVIAGTSFQILEWGYINFQVGVSRYNTIYGSFAALPLFMVWTNFSWLITLVGAEIGYANQYVTNIELELDERELSQFDRKAVALILCQRIFNAFVNGKAAYTAEELSSSLTIPFGVTAQVLELLHKAGLLVEIQNGDNDVKSFQPAMSVEKVRMTDVFNSIDDLDSTKELRILKDAKAAAYLDRINGLRASMDRAPENTLVKDLPDIIVDGESTR